MENICNLQLLMEFKWFGTNFSQSVSNKFSKNWMRFCEKFTENDFKILYHGYIWTVVSKNVSVLHFHKKIRDEQIMKLLQIYTFFHAAFHTRSKNISFDE